MKILNLNNNIIQDISPVGRLTNLEDLRLLNVPVTDYAPINTLSNLKKLVLSSSVDESIVSALKKENTILEIVQE